MTSTEVGISEGAGERHAPSSSASASSGVISDSKEAGGLDAASSLSMEELIQEVMEANPFPVCAQQSSKDVGYGSATSSSESGRGGGGEEEDMGGEGGVDLSELVAESSAGSSAVLAALRSLVEVMNAQGQGQRSVEEEEAMELQQGE